MPNLAPRSICTGCSACFAACPFHAIEMVADEEGFSFPEVKPDMCRDCHCCERACPVGKSREIDLSPACFAAYSPHEKTVLESSSGGVFTELAQVTLGMGGVVFGAAYDGKELQVVHKMAREQTELSMLRGSKYVQSQIGGVYRDVKALLKSDQRVLFSGTPCQIAGLKGYLHDEYANLLTVEIICHGVPPPKLFDVLKKNLQRAHGELTAVSFRDKAEGWNSRAITGWYHGVKVRERDHLNDYFWAFLEHLTLRHSCETCEFNNSRSGADITLGDFWGVNRVCPEIANNVGVSAVIAHTRKGLEAFEKTSCRKVEVSLGDITSGNPSYCDVRVANAKRNRFMRDVYKLGISGAYKKYRWRESILKRVVRRLRLIMRKVI